MRREFTFYGKKRGDRRTGSSQAGRGALGLFFALFLAAGCGALTLILYTLTIPEWRVNHEFRETTCTVLDSMSRPSGADEPTFRPEFQIRYTVGQQTFTRWAPYEITGAYTSDREAVEAIRARHPVHQQYPCWYDPRNPQTVVMRRGYTWRAWLMLLLPAAFITVGGGGLTITLLRWGKSTERLAAMTHQLPARELLEPILEQRSQFPGLPDDADLTNSPGVVLRYRLPTTSASWTLLGTLAFCVFWNGVVAVLTTIAIRGHVVGDPDWLLTFFVIPFAVVGGAAVYVLSRQLMIATGVGPTTVEVADHPLAPDQETEVYVSQAGRLSIQRLCVLLICEETAVYRQGTNTRTSVRRVYEHQVFEREGFEIQPGLPFEARFTVKIPQHAMHSFASRHNRIEWKLLVVEEVARWPDVERGYPLVVYPPVASEVPA